MRTWLSGWLAVCLFTATIARGADLPVTWVGVGGASSPAGSTWVSYAVLVSPKAMAYSYTTQNLTFDRASRQIQISPRTGLATVLRQFGPFTVLAIGDAGMAGQGKNVGGAFSGSGVVIVKLGKTNWTLLGGYRALKTSVGTSQRLVEFGLGRINP